MALLGLVLPGRHGGLLAYCARQPGHFSNLIKHLGNALAPVLLSIGKAVPVAERARDRAGVG